MSHLATPRVDCTRHPEAVAGWRCALCASELCVKCAAMTQNHVVVCGTCGSLAQVHLAPRGEVFPFSVVWREALAELRSTHGLLQIAVIGTAAHGFFTIGKYCWALGLLLTGIWVANLVRRAALGIGAFGAPEWEDVRLVLVGPLLRFACAAAPLGVGAMVWMRAGLVSRPLFSMWTWVIALAAVVVIPPALTAAAVEGEGRTFPWPWRLGPWLGRLGADLRPLQVAVAIAALFEILESVLPPADRELEDMQMMWHLFSSWVPRLLSFTAMAAVGVLAGRLAYTRAGELGHRRAEDDRVPRETAPPVGVYIPPERDLEAEAAARARKFAPIAIDGLDQPSAIARGARDEAIAAYRAGDLRADALELEPAVTLAQWLAGTGDFLAAANLLRVVTSRVGGDDNAIAKALVVLARLCAERLDARTEALRLYDDVVQRFPTSPAAKFAAEQLLALR